MDRRTVKDICEAGALLMLQLLAVLVDQRDSAAVLVDRAGITNWSGLDEATIYLFKLSRSDLSMSRW